MEGVLAFKKGSLRFRKAEMKKFYFVLTHNPTNAEFRYVLTWFKDDSKIKLKGSLNITRCLEIAPEGHKQLFLGYYFQIRNAEDGEAYHFSADTKEVLERWVSKLREATLTDVYAGFTKANKFREQTVVNVFLTNNCIAFVHPISEETLLSWKLSQIVSFVFDQTEFSFVICSKCSKVAGRFTQEVTLQTAILIIGTMEDRISRIYANSPGAVITHERNISGDVYRVPHVCRRLVDSTHDILSQSTAVRFQNIPNSPTSSSGFSAPSNRSVRSNSMPGKQDLFIRSLSNSPVSTAKHSPLSPGRNLLMDVSRISSLPLGTQRRFPHNSVQRVPLAQAHNTKNSLDSWQSNSCSHTLNTRNSCLSEIKWPQSYQPKNRMLAASLENLDVKADTLPKPQYAHSKWPFPSSTETSDYSEGISQSNYSPSFYQSSGAQSSHCFSPPPSLATGQECWKKEFVKVPTAYSIEDAKRGNSLPRSGRICPPDSEISPNHRPVKSLSDTTRVFPLVSRDTYLSGEPRSGRVPTGKPHYQMPRHLEETAVHLSPDSEHVYSIPNIHSRSMEILNAGTNVAINSSSNTSSSDYYEPMKSSAGVRHKPKHINTIRARTVRKSKRDQSSDSSACSFTSESSGNTSVSTDEGIAMKDCSTRTHL